MAKQRDTDAVRQAFGRRLKELRDARGLTQDELASRAEIGREVLSRYENANRWPGSDVVQALADALGVHFSAFLLEERDADAEAAAVLVRRISDPERRETALRVLRDLQEKPLK